MLSRNSANWIGEARLSRGCQVTDAHGVKRTAVLIIGGDWTGVSAALELERLGIDYHLLEADAHRLGGRAFSYTYKQGSQEVCFDHGAQYIGKHQSEIWNLAQQHLPHAIIDGYEARIAYKDQVMLLDQKRYCYNRDECLFGIGGVPPVTELVTDSVQRYESPVDVKPVPRPGLLRSESSPGCSSR
jgi:NAD(P)-binding Rossmann-like domain